MSKLKESVNILWCCSYYNAKGKNITIAIEADTEELAQIYCEDLNLTLGGKLVASYDADIDNIDAQKTEMQEICDVMNVDEKISEIKDMLSNGLPNITTEGVLAMLADYQNSLAEVEKHANDLKELIAIVEAEKQKRVN